MGNNNPGDDAGTNYWPLMDSPFPTLVICFSYVFMAKVWGPVLMKNRSPFDFRYVIIQHDIFQVTLNAFLFYEFSMSEWLTKHSNVCNPDSSDSPRSPRMANVCWWYYLSKLTEMGDTIFFILRKKDRHMTTLHVISHSIMPINVWIGVKFIPGGLGSFIGLINAFMQTIVYTYYLLAAFGPSVQKHLWWKKFVTLSQQIQLLAIIFHAMLFIDCNYPRSFILSIVFQAIVFLYLLRAFYIRSYKRKKIAVFRHRTGHRMLVIYDEEFDFYYKGKLF